MFTVIGKYLLVGVDQNGNSYKYHRVYCTLSPSDEELRNGFEGLKTKAFNFSPSLFNEVEVGEQFKEPLFNDARTERDKCVRYLIR